MDRLRKSPVAKQGGGPAEVREEVLNQLKEEFKASLEEAVQEAVSCAHYTTTEQVLKEVDDAGFFHDVEWPASVKDEFHKSLEVCLSTFQDAFLESMLEQLDEPEDEDEDEDERDDDDDDDEDSSEVGFPQQDLDTLPLHKQLHWHLRILGITQAKAAAVLGVSKMSISQWIKGPTVKGGRPIPKKRIEQVRAWVSGKVNKK